MRIRLMVWAATAKKWARSLNGGFATCELFRRHVRRRAAAHVTSVHVFGNFGEPEVHDADLAAPVAHDVGRLEVAVQYFLDVRGRQPGAQPARDLESRALAGTRLASACPSSVGYQPWPTMRPETKILYSIVSPAEGA